MFIAAQGGGRKGDLSRFIEGAAHALVTSDRRAGLRSCRQVGGCRSMAPAAFCAQALWRGGAEDNSPMNWRNVFIPLVLIALLFAGWRAAGWQGLAIAGGGVLMWALLHFTRLMNVMQKAARNPIGSVSSAVMLNARLKPGATLMHVVALTRALGERLSMEGVQPEVYRWRDASAAQVTCTFAQGRLAHWQLERETERPPSPGAGAEGGGPIVE